MLEDNKSWHMSEEKKDVLEDKVRTVLISDDNSKKHAVVSCFKFYELFARNPKMREWFKAFIYEFGDEIQYLLNPEKIIRMRRYIQNDKGDLRPIDDDTIMNSRMLEEKKERAHWGAVGRQHNFGN